MGGRGAGAGPAVGEEKRWSVAAVGKLQSGNEPGMTVAQEYAMKEGLGKYSENDYARSGKEGPRAYQAEITDSIRQKGQINAVQWSKEDRQLVEGYHRYAAARQLGQKTMRVKRAY